MSLPLPDRDTASLSPLAPAADLRTEPLEYVSDLVRFARRDAQRTADGKVEDFSPSRPRKRPACPPVLKRPPASGSDDRQKSLGSSARAEPLSGQREPAGRPLAPRSRSSQDVGPAGSVGPPVASQDCRATAKSPDSVAARIVLFAHYAD